MNERVQPPELPASRTAQVMADIRGRIGAGQLVPNDRLPSIRRLAVELSVSPSTVVEAYDRLSAEGLIRPRPVPASSSPRPGARLHPVVRLEPRAPEVDPFWVARQALDADPGTSKPGCGWLPPDWMPTALPMPACATCCARRPASPPITVPRAAARPPAFRRNAAASAIDYAVRGSGPACRLRHPGARSRLPAVAPPGDRVIVDDPCYFNFQTLLRAHQASRSRCPIRKTAQTSPPSRPPSPARHRGFISPIPACTIRRARRSRRRLPSSCSASSRVRICWSLRTTFFAISSRSRRSRSPRSTGFPASSASAAFPRRFQPRCAPASSPPIPSASGS